MLNPPRYHAVDNLNFTIIIPFIPILPAKYRTCNPTIRVVRNVVPGNCYFVYIPIYSYIITKYYILQTKVDSLKPSIQTQWNTSETAVLHVHRLHRDVILSIGAV